MAEESVQTPTDLIKFDHSKGWDPSNSPRADLDDLSSRAETLLDAYNELNLADPDDRELAYGLMEIVRRDAARTRKAVVALFGPQKPSGTA